MDRNELSQHIALMVSFFGLAITGFSLRFADVFWVQWLFGWEGGYSLRGTIHRVAAVVFIVTVLWHLSYLFSNRGKQFFQEIKPCKKDFHHLVHTLSYNLNFRIKKPRSGRFGYVEKIEYWALFWGVIVMVITGTVMWLDNFSMRLFTKLGWDIARAVHFYEACLASLAVLVWHFYFVILNPRIYPMNTAWITGKVSEAEMAEEHPLELGRTKSPTAGEPR